MLEMFSADIFFKGTAHVEVLGVATEKSAISCRFSPATTLFELSSWVE